jgi:hypothetical protein
VVLTLVRVPAVPVGQEGVGDPMPRTVKEILDQAAKLSELFEARGSAPGGVMDALSLHAVRLAFQARADAERGLVEAVVLARRDGHSWAAIGAMVGTSGEAARQRYGSRSPSR